MSSKSHHKDLKRAKILLKEVNKLNKRFGNKIDPRQHDNLVAQIKSLENAIQNDLGLKDEILKLEQIAGRCFEPYRKSTWREYAESITIAIVIALILRTFVIEPFKIPSGSMIPTLKIGDHIFVNKFSYGLWIPFVGKKWRMGQGPKRGDVVVFIYPVDPSKDFIKRVVGLPGDEIIIKYNKLHINGQLVTTEAKDLYTYSEQETPHSIAAERTCRVHQANIFGAIHQILLDEEHPSSLQNWNANHSPQGATKPWKGPKIPPGYVFVMGDNRDHSSDSREWGLVPIENIKGKAVLVWLSFGGEKGFRWDRIFVPIR